MCDVHAGKDNGLPETLLGRFPHVKAHFGRIASLPVVQKYLSAGGK